MIALKSQYEILDVELNPSGFFYFLPPPLPDFTESHDAVPLKKEQPRKVEMLNT